MHQTVVHVFNLLERLALKVGGDTARRMMHPSIHLN
jgi:hypothetical protein